LQENSEPTRDRLLRSVGVQRAKLLAHAPWNDAPHFRFLDVFKVHGGATALPSTATARGSRDEVRSAIRRYFVDMRLHEYRRDANADLSATDYAPWTHELWFLS
jgi:hypothetical protein